MSARLNDNSFLEEPFREPLKTHLREKELLAPTASSSLLTLRGLPGSGEVEFLALPKTAEGVSPAGGGGEAREG